jgi:hypothetical protein
VEPCRSTEVELLTVSGCSGLVVRHVDCRESADLEDLDLKFPLRVFRRLVAPVGPRRYSCDGLDLVVLLRCFNDVTLRRVRARTLEGRGVRQASGGQRACRAARRRGVERRGARGSCRRAHE